MCRVWKSFCEVRVAKKMKMFLQTVYSRKKSTKKRGEVNIVLGKKNEVAKREKF